MLHRAGYKTVNDVAKATPKDLVNVVEHLSLHIARQIVDSAKVIFKKLLNQTNVHIMQLNCKIIFFDK